MATTKTPQSQPEKIITMIEKNHTLVTSKPVGLIKLATVTNIW
jgi:hypothetical protein